MSPESVAFHLLLAAALLPLTLALLRRGARRGGALALGLWTLAALAASSERSPVGRPAPAPEDRPIAVEEEGYVSSDACRACHPAHWSSWHDSYHRTMTQVASSRAIVAPFDGRRVTFDGLSYVLERDGERFFVEMPDPDRPRGDDRVRVEIELVTGSHHEQDFWYSAGQGRGLRRVPIVYRIAEDRWLPNEAVFLQPPGVHHAQAPMPPNEWNTSCIKCHATHGRPGFRADGEAWADTEVAEFGIACEACHGPAEGHVARNHNPLRRYASHLGGGHDGAVVDPSELTPARSAEVCGQCHSITSFDDVAAMREWAAEGTSFRPGGTLAQAHRYVARVGEAATRPALRAVVQADPGFLGDRFWDDGSVRVSGREYNGLLESPCFRDGSQADDMSCLSCHRLHRAEDDPRPLARWRDDQLAVGMDGDGACLQCHAELGAELEAHTHHPAASEGSRCMNCHMPYTTLGLLKAIRSHRVDSPDLASSQRSRRPDACSLCHLDRSREWVGERLQAWYGQPPPAATDLAWRVPAALAWALSGDAGVRELVAWHLGWSAAREASGGASRMVALLVELLDDPYDAVRFNAERSLRSIEGFADLDYDFVANRRARERAQQEALARQRAAGGEASLERLFEGCDAGTIEALRSLRDERRVHLKE